MEDFLNYVGIGAFLFFLIKGILWIIVFLFAGKKIKESKWWKSWMKK